MRKFYLLSNYIKYQYANWFNKFLGVPMPDDCTAPSCGVANFKFIDSWVSDINGIGNGFVATVTVPETEFDENGWTVVLRFNIEPDLFQAGFKRYAFEKKKFFKYK